MVFTEKDVKEMVALKRRNVPMAVIARHFNTTTSSIRYHTSMIAKMDLDEVLHEIYMNKSSELNIRRTFSVDLTLQPVQQNMNYDNVIQTQQPEAAIA